MSTQKQMCDAALRHISDRHRVFMVIMSGPNPLTAAEVQRLAEKYPERWGCYVAVMNNISEKEGR